MKKGMETPIGTCVLCDKYEVTNERNTVKAINTTKKETNNPIDKERC